MLESGKQLTGSQAVKKYLLAFVFLLAIGIIISWWINRQPSLIDLQKEYLFAKTDAEREKVIDRLEEYYLNLAIPDSIRQQVDNDVAKVLETTKINVAEFSQENWDTTNVYELETQIKSLLETAMIARARGEKQTFADLMELAQKMAKAVDEGTQAKYWVLLIDEVSEFSKDQAISWLNAEIALNLCTTNIDSDYLKAEEYASIGLRHLKYANDERLRLNIMNRFQIILYLFRGMYDLSFALADRSLENANSVNDHLRANGIMYYKAEALKQNGQIEAGLELFQKVIQNTETYKEIKLMSWYRTNSMLQIAICYWQLNQFENALNICEKVEKLVLSSNEKALLHNIKGTVYQRLGNYETAESEYTVAINIADSANIVIINQIKFLNNLGRLYYLLTEHHLALDYYYKAKNLLEERNPENYEYRINLIINIANVMAELNRMATVDSLITEAKRLSRLGISHWKNADLLNTIGNFNLSRDRNHTAYENFQEALSICKNNGLIRLGLLIQLNLAESSIRLSNFSEARKELLEALFLAKQINDSERIIDAIAKLAKLEKRNGNIANAVETSKRLIPEIEKIFSRFNNEHRMISFLQKIYGYLKEAVVYKLQYQRADSAYALFDYAKARSLKNHHNFGNGHKESNNGLFHLLDINTLQSRLKVNRIVIDYLVAEDTLYAFVLDHEELLVLRKAMDIEVLKAAVDAYKNSIENTINLFSHNYNQSLVQAHFDSTIQLSKKLFDLLMGWPSLIAKIRENKRVYIIPDEFLYDLPFATLVENVSEKGTFLAQDAAIVTLPSASFIQSVSGNTGFNNMKLKRILVSADPDIPGSKDFVAFIKRQFPSAEELYVDKSPFDKNDILMKLNEAHDIYIFLGHGSANSRYPDLSFIEISATNTITSEIKKFQVTISDLKQINWPGAEMVMLVGCETGSGKPYRGTGIVGLQQGFVSLGSQNVLASLWKIDARKAIPQIQNFVEYLDYTSDPVIALNEVQVESMHKLLRSNYYKKPHPYYWGSFILSSKTN